jgi:hypothetical protein
VKPIEPRRGVKEHEKGPKGGVVENPGLVKLKEARGWQPIKYVTYLWLLIDKDDLRVGIETQVAAPKLPGNQEPTSSHQKEAYGHPTLSGAATCDAQGNPLRTWKRQEDGTWKAEKRRTPA